MWIVKALIRIEEDVNSLHIFPEFLDEKSIKFLVDYAQLEIKYEDFSHEL